MQSSFISRASLVAAVRLYESFLDRDAFARRLPSSSGNCSASTRSAALAAGIDRRAVGLRPQAAFFRATLAEAYRAWATTIASWSAAARRSSLA